MNRRGFFSSLGAGLVALAATTRLAQASMVLVEEEEEKPQTATTVYPSADWAGPDGCMTAMVIMALFPDGRREIRMIQDYKGGCATVDVGFTQTPDKSTVFQVFNNDGKPFLPAHFI